MINKSFCGTMVRGGAATAASLLIAASLFAVEVPPLTGRVNDYAGMMSPETKAALEKRLAGLESTDSTQVALLTVPDLQGVTIEEFSLKVAEQWKIGKHKLDNGVIFIVSKNERKMRIEVGYGLEGRLTDLLAGRILDYEVKPSFKAGDFDRGFIKGVEGIILAVRGEYKGAGDISAGDGVVQPAGTSPGPEGYSVIFFLIYLVVNMIMGARGILYGTVTGAVLLPLCFVFMDSLTLVSVLWLIFIGLFIGFVLSLIGRGMSAGGTGGGSGGGWSGSGGSYGSGGFSGGGGSFSGGGGSFGGGGASSGW